MRKKKYTYQEVYNSFLKRGWILLSKFYKNYRQKLKFKCNNGHNQFLKKIILLVNVVVK
jgi:hypothetical protein